MDDLSHTAGVNMSKQVLNHAIFISDHVRYNLLLFAVDEELNNLAEIAREYRIDRLFACVGLDEFKQAVEEHVFAQLLVI